MRQPYFSREPKALPAITGANGEIQPHQHLIGALKAIFRAF
jgi:hypothetical protein